MKIQISFSILFLLSTLNQANANPNAATITSVEGDVKIFSNPSKEAAGPAPRALFEGEYFTVTAAKSGDTIEKGNILRTSPGAKAKVVYENGDSFNVGSATAYRIKWEDDAAKGKTEVAMMYGKIRGVVSKEGPRSRLFIKTKSAVMGVRGTDFFIADDGGKGTEVSVLRGKVEVENKPTTTETTAKKVQIAQGQSAEVTAEAKTKPIEVKKTTKEELTAISKSTTTAIKTTDEIKHEVRDIAQVSKVQELEKKAAESTLKDIKNYDKKLYDSLNSKGVTSTTEINQQVVANLTAKAPDAPKKRKPYRAELENLGDDAYKRYFKE